MGYSPKVLFLSKFRNNRHMIQTARATGISGNRPKLVTSRIPIPTAIRMLARRICEGDVLLLNVFPPCKSKGVKLVRAIDSGLSPYRLAKTQLDLQCETTTARGVPDGIRRMVMATGVTPEILLAWPRLKGLNRRSFSLISEDRPWTP